MADFEVMSDIDRGEPLLPGHLPRLLTVGDVVDVLGVNERTVRRLVARVSSRGFESAGLSGMTRETCER